MRLHSRSGCLEKAALYDLQAQVEATIQDVKIRYFDVLLARDTIAVEAQNLELLKEQLENTESRFEAGAVSQFDVLQAALANAKPALILANNDFRIAEAELQTCCRLCRRQLRCQPLAEVYRRAGGSYQGLRFVKFDDARATKST